MAPVSRAEPPASRFVYDGMSRTRLLAAVASVVLAVATLVWESDRGADARGSVAASAVASVDGGGPDAPPAALAVAADLEARSVERRDLRRTRESAVLAGTLLDADDEVCECECECAPDDCPTRLEFIDAITGREIEVPPTLTDDRDRQVMVPDPYWGRAGRRAGADAGASSDRVVRAAAMVLPRAVPSPYLPWRPFESATLSDRATSFHAVVPLDHEVSVQLRLLDPEGRPDADAFPAYWVVVDRLVNPARVARQPDGSIRLLGVPWLPGESFRLGFRSHAPPRPTEAAADAPAADAPAAAEPVDDARIFAMTIPMPDSPHEPIVRDVQPAWEAPPNVFKGRGGHRNLRAGCGCSGCREAPTDLGDVRLRFLDAGRRPIRDLRVRVASTTMLTDADGVVGLRKVLDRSHVEVVDVGYRFEDAVIYVDPDREVVRELVEAPAGTLDVSVVDASGRAVPSATISVEPESFGWFDVDAQGVQRLDPFTDVTGRRTCHDVPAGEATVRASYGRRRGEAKVVVVANAPSVVRITVK